MPWMLLLACRPGADDREDSRVIDTRDSDASGQVFELVVSAGDDQQVIRARVSEGVPERLWTWDVQDDRPGHPHKPHGLHLADDVLTVSLFDFFTDAFTVQLDVDTGAELRALVEPTNERYGGAPGLLDHRGTHNAVPDPTSPGTWVYSDTYNHRILAQTEAGEFAWEISQQTISGDRYLRRHYVHPNDVEFIEVDGKWHLLTSSRGESFNHILLWSPAEPLRPQDPPWRPEWRYPQENHVPTMHMNHNPQPLADGTGLMVLNSHWDRIDAISWSGELLWSLPETTCESSPLDWPRDAKWTPWGTLLVADSENDRIVELDPAIPCPTESDLLWIWDGLALPYEILLVETP